MIMGYETNLLLLALAFPVSVFIFLIIVNLNYERIDKIFDEKGKLK